MKFVTKGFEGKTFGCSKSQTELEISGQWYVQGRQTVCENGCPEWVADIFNDNPDIEIIAIGRQNHGTVYSR